MMAFLRVVEVLPPLYPASRRTTDPIALEASAEKFTESVRAIRRFSDVVLVANVKNPGVLKVDTVHAAMMLRGALNVDAAPVIVVRDQNRMQFLSTVLSALSAGLRSLMIAWGDDYTEASKVTNVRDFDDLAGAIRQASRLRFRARSSARFFAPIDVNSLAYPKGVALAKARLRAGADMLLAQPPTTDANAEFDRHSSLVRAASLKDKVLLGVFPFRDRDDVRRYEALFGWKLPASLQDNASNGEKRLEELEKGVIRRLREEKWPGVYLSTRGNPAVAEALLA